MSAADRVSRADRAVEALRLRAQGLLYREIADRLGVSPSYAQVLVSDPDGAKDRARKERYRGTCGTCGASTTGCNGPGAAPTVCANCARAAARTWTPETIIAAFRAYHAATGFTPSASDAIAAPSFDAKFAPERRARIATRVGVRLPDPGAVRREFPGGWHEAVRAAGLDPVPYGRTAFREQQAVAYLDRPRRFHDVRDHLGISTGHASKLLAALVAKRRVQRVSTGVYVRAA